MANHRSGLKTFDLSEVIKWGGSKDSRPIGTTYDHNGELRYLKDRPRHMGD
jgi:hypothetical protein